VEKTSADAFEGTSVLRLRGLPFNCSEQEIYAFFSKHEVVEHIADVNKAVTFLTKSNGKSSGQATVQMSSKQAARVAAEQLNGQWIGSRYIEVFPYTEEEPAEKDAGAAEEQEPEVPSAGDTGGSGGTPPGAMAPPWQQQPAWGLGRGGPADLEMQAMLQMQMAQGGMPMASPFQGGMFHGGAGTGGEGGPAQSAESWNALFDFLKRDPSNQMPGMEFAPPNANVKVNPI
jgi:RNA recognition motif-containing protein